MEYNVYSSEELALIHEALKNRKYYLRRAMDINMDDDALYKALITEYNKYSVIAYKILCLMSDYVDTDSFRLIGDDEFVRV